MKPEISNKKKKFIKRNVKRLSLEELARHTGLKPNVIRSIIDKENSEMPEKDQSTQIKNRSAILPPLKIILLTFFLFTAIVLVLYSPGFHGGFVLDDHVLERDSLFHITQLSQLFDLVTAKELGRRIGYITFALNYYWGEFNPLGYRLVNVIIHSLNGLMLFLLSFTMLALFSGKGQDKKQVLVVAFLGSLLWLVHPLQSQAVVYIIQRLASLCTLFFLLSLFCYLQGRLYHARRRLIFFLLSFLFGMLALDTKQNAATLPLFIILAEFFFFQRDSFSTNKKRLWILIAGGGLFVLITGMYLDPDFIARMAEGYDKRGWTMPERLLTELRVVMFYLGLLIYPHPSRLNLDHDFSVSTSLFSPFTTCLSLLVIIGLLGLSLWMVKRNRLVAYALLWFMGNLVIESSIIPLELVFEHRMYLPSMGLIVLGVGIVMWVLKEDWRRWGIGGMLAVSLVFCYWTYERAFIWRDQISLWMDAVQKSPNKARPRDNLGVLYDEKGMVDEAIKEYQRALAINPSYLQSHYNLGIAYAKTGRLDDAITEHQKALVSDPNYSFAHFGLGNVYEKKGMVDQAISAYMKTIAVDPNHTGANTNLAAIYIQRGMLQEAITACNKALNSNPNLPEAHYNLGNIFFRKGELDEAIGAYRNAVNNKPDYVEARYALGLTYSKKGMLEEAIAEYKKVITVNPDHAMTHNNLGNIYENKNMFEEAFAEYKKAVSIDPDLPPAQYNLGRSYLKKGLQSQAAEHFYSAGLLFLKRGNKEWAQRAYGVLKQTNSKQLEKALYEQLNQTIQ